MIRTQRADSETTIAARLTIMDRVCYGVHSSKVGRWATMMETLIIIRNWSAVNLIYQSERRLGIYVPCMCGTASPYLRVVQEGFELRKCSFGSVEERISSYRKGEGTRTDLSRITLQRMHTNILY